MDYVTYQRAKWENAQRETGRQVYAHPLGVSLSMTTFMEDMQLYIDDLRREWRKSLYSTQEFVAMYQTLAEINVAINNTARAADTGTTPNAVRQDIRASQGRLYDAMRSVTAIVNSHSAAIKANEMISDPEWRTAVLYFLDQAKWTFGTVQYISSIKPWFLDNRIAEIVLDGIEKIVTICQTVKEWTPPSFSLPGFGAIGDIMKWSMYGGVALLLWWVLKKPKKGAAR
jgi:hypothetical protein